MADVVSIWTVVDLIAISTSIDLSKFRSAVLKLLRTSKRVRERKRDAQREREKEMMMMSDTGRDLV